VKLVPTQGDVYRTARCRQDFGVAWGDILRPMFSLHKPTDTLIRETLVLGRNLPISYGLALNTEDGAGTSIVPSGFVLDHTRSEIGRGREAFEAAKEALRQWRHFDLGWVRVANPEARIEVEEVVAVEAHALGLWSVNVSRILYVIDEADRFGFGYGTTAMHVERGEERFLLEYYPVSGVVFYDLLAISEPAHWMARLAYLFTRSRQRKFARESHLRMRQAVVHND
jgi:uncharacterized protein (UPF0548 family)